MIISVVPESTWAEFLSDLPRWEPPISPTIVIAPHPDDETLGAGGLIASLREKNVDVVVVAVTDGENAYENAVGLGQVRKIEQVNALKYLGVPQDKIVRFELPDSDVISYEQDLVDKLLPLLSKSTHIVAPWPGDFHPDHEATGRAAIEASRQTGATLTFYFFWTWHRGTPDILPKSDLRSMTLTNEALSAKRNALECHQSQLQHVSGEPILPANLLDPAERAFEVFLVQ
jgi:LmbE family N-acetylglucosaminyl deacetylase